MLWHDDPRDMQKWRAETVSITPRVVCELIRMAHRNGWDPERSKTEFEWFVDRGEVSGIGELQRKYEGRRGLQKLDCACSPDGQQRQSNP